MANKRMFTTKITDSNAFIDMPSSAQLLYIHLNMASDDDGFCNQVNICIYKAHASQDDLKMLIAKKFILPFDNGIVVIKHWRMHNLLRKDRYHETTYQEEKSKLFLKENGSYTFNDNEGKKLIDIEKNVIENKEWQPNGNQMAPENRLDKNRLDKNSIVEKEKEKEPTNKQNDIDYLKMMLEIGGLSKTKEAIDEYIKNNDLKLTDSEYQEIMKGI